MAAPASARKYSWTFRDDKGQTARMRALLGGASIAAIDADANTFDTHLQAVSNAFVSRVDSPTINHTYGTNADYETVEDKAQLTFTDPDGLLHRFQVAAPKSAIFLSDGETVDPANSDIVALVGDFGSFVYGRSTDVSPLVFVGGVRIRRKLKRKFNIFTLTPQLAAQEPGE